MSEQRSTPFFLILLLACFASMLAILFTPALPFLVRYFGISDNQSKATVYYYLFGYSIGNLLYGPYANRYGRKQGLYFGITLTLFGVLVCIASIYLKIFFLMNVGRIIQAFGATSGLVLAYTLTSEGHPHPKNIQYTSLISMAFAIGPNIGVAIGGFLTQYLGWTSCFYFMLTLSVLYLLLVKFYVKETLEKKDLSALKITSVCTKLSHTFSNKTVVYAGLVLGFAIPFSYIFSVKAPFIVIKAWNYTPSSYGLFNLIPPLFLIAGSVTVKMLIKKIKITFLIFLGISLISACSILFFFLFSLKLMGVFLLFLLFGLILYGQAFATSSAASFSVHRAKDKSTASGVMSFINLMLCTLFIVILSFGNAENMLYMPLLYLILSFILFFVYFGLRKYFICEKE